jgi:hypothetical protein
MPFSQSTYTTPVAQQNNSISSFSAHSVMNILWLNETMPPFMSRVAMYHPFGPLSVPQSTEAEETWTGTTQRYIADIDCEEPSLWQLEQLDPYVNSTWGCSYPVPDITGLSNNSDPRSFELKYIGFYDDDGQAQYSLEKYCPSDEPRSFLIQYAETRLTSEEMVSLSKEEIRQRSNVTTRYCRSSYYIQDVMATVSIPNMHIIDPIFPISPPRLLSPDIFNITDFEAAMNMETPRSRIRTDFPAFSWPYQEPFLQQYPLRLEHLTSMAAFAVGSTQELNAELYLDPQYLDNSLRQAYQVVFARQMSQFVSLSLNNTARHPGFRQYSSQAIVVIPAFIYASQAFLGAILMLAAILLLFSSRTSKLWNDPACISAMMALAAEDDSLLATFRDTDTLSMDQLHAEMASRTFRLSSTGVLQHVESSQATAKTLIDTNQPGMSERDTNLVNGVRPTELRTSIGLIFLIIQLASAILLPILFLRMKSHNGRSTRQRHTESLTGTKAFHCQPKIDLGGSFWRTSSLQLLEA